MITHVAQVPIDVYITDTKDRKKDRRDNPDLPMHIIHVQAKKEDAKNKRYDKRHGIIVVLKDIAGNLDEFGNHLSVMHRIDTYLLIGRKRKDGLTDRRGHGGNNLGIQMLGISIEKSDNYQHDKKTSGVIEKRLKILFLDLEKDHPREPGKKNDFHGKDGGGEDAIPGNKRAILITILIKKFLIHFYRTFFFSLQREKKILGCRLSIVDYA